MTLAAQSRNSVRGDRNRAAQGFSLAEVAMAVSILSFALVTLLALVPAAMTMFRESVDNTVRAQIQQRMSSEVALLDYTNLTTKVGNTPQFFDRGFPRYFGEDGQPTNKNFAVFAVGPYVAGTTNGVFAVTSPGGSTIPLSSACNVIFALYRPNQTSAVPFYFSVLKANDGR